MCSRCVYDETVPGIVFDGAGVCNYCRLHNRLAREYPSGPEGERRLRRIVDEIREAGKGKRYDCVVGISGGCDSSFLLYKMKEFGLRPLADHFDNTWNSTIATENMQNLLKELGLNIFTYVVDNEEYDQIYRAFLLAGVPDTEIPTDIGLAAVLNMAAEKHNIRYVIEGHPFRTEGISPIGWTYMDGRYIEDIASRHAGINLRTFLNMKMFRFLKWMLWNRIKKIRPLWYIDHNKEETKRFLSENFGWKWYGGHHLENRFTVFYHSYILPRRWGYDKRKNGFSALIRSGQMTKEEILQKLHRPHEFDPEILKLVKKRLGFSDEEWEKVMRLPKRNYRNYRTYKRTFERLRPFFWIMAKMDYVPRSFYEKFCQPDTTTPYFPEGGDPQ